jgi:hypothetical protein
MQERFFSLYSIKNGWQLHRNLGYRRWLKSTKSIGRLFVWGRCCVNSTRPIQVHFSKFAISRLENLKVMIAVLNLFEGHAKRELQENTRR